MTDSEIDLNLDFQRAMLVLDSAEWTTPERLFSMWKMQGTWPVRYPVPERRRPWYGGLEHLI